MKKKNKNALIVTTAAVLTIILMIAGILRLVRFLADGWNDLFTLPVHSSSVNTPETPYSASSPETGDTNETLPETTTEEVSYPAESLPDYDVHTLPHTTEESTTEQPTSPEPTADLTAPEETIPSASGSADTPEATQIPNATEFSENSDNLPFIGTWRLEYDLAPAQAEALGARYSLSRMPERSVIVRLFAELRDDGTFRIIFTQEDADAFKTALNGWYGDAASIYAESGAGTVQKAAFASWAAYRKGLYSLLSPDAVARAEADWHAEAGTVYVTDDGEIQAEIHTLFEAEGLTVTGFSVSNGEFRDTVALMQSTLGFKAPYHLTKD